jgi:hypothetical protein
MQSSREVNQRVGSSCCHLQRVSRVDPDMQNQTEDQGCGFELAQSALVPELIGALMLHVTQNLEAHAQWVGASSEAARLEQRALRQVAADYRAIAEAAARAVQHMRAAAGLASPRHDPDSWDRSAFLAWMRRKLELQRALAELLLEHARLSERALEQA